MKYKALPIKNWIIHTLSPADWSLLIARAIPELLEINPHFSAYYVSGTTEWSEEEVAVLRWYLRRLYAIDLPEELLLAHGGLAVEYLQLISFDFFKSTRNGLAILKNSIFNIFKL